MKKMNTQKTFLVQGIVTRGEYDDEPTEGYIILGEVSVKDETILKKLNEYPHYLINNPINKQEHQVFDSDIYYDNKGLMMEKFVIKHKKMFTDDVYDFIINWWNANKYKKKPLYWEIYKISDIINDEFRDFKTVFNKTVTRKKLEKELNAVLDLYYKVTDRFWKIQHKKLIANYPPFKYPDVEKYINKQMFINSKTKFYYIEFEIKKLF